MRRPHDPRPYIHDILDCIERIQRYTKGLDARAFHEDEILQDAVVRRIEIIGEAAGRLPDELKARYPHIPWQDIRGMRNKLIHEYGHVDPDLVWAAVRQDLPTLEAAFRQMLNHL